MPKARVVWVIQSSSEAMREELHSMWPIHPFQGCIGVMDSPPPDNSGASATHPRRLPTEVERQALSELAAQALATASDSIERFAAVLARSRHQLHAAEQRLAAIDATRETVRQSVQRYTRLMRALESPPERVLSLVKETLRQQVTHPEQAAETLELAEDVVTWCIEAYYDGLPAA